MPASLKDSEPAMPSLLQWLRQHLRSKPLPAPDQLAGLDLTAAVQAHQRWCERLSSGATGLDAAVIGRDDLCDLGQWLQGSGRQQFGHLAEYRQACQAHSEFHHCAGELLLGHQAAQSPEILQPLEQRLRTASSRNQLELVRLFAAARQ